MTEIYLIRHGQASFGTDDYDKLSPLGEHQCVLLGRHLAATGLTFDAIYSGPLQRQRESCRITGEHTGVADDAAVHEAFREYDAREIFNAYLPQVMESHPELAAHEQDIHQDRRLFQRALMAVMDAWLDEARCHEPIETWPQFRARVIEQIRELLDTHASRERIAIHTSGGVIAVAVGHALGLDSRRTIAMNWQVINSAVTKLHFGRSGFMLAGFNNIAHLEKEYDPGVITYR
jgi:broad specificity phosphatase PhoE